MYPLLADIFRRELLVHNIRTESLKIFASAENVQDLMRDFIPEFDLGESLTVDIITPTGLATIRVDSSLGKDDGIIVYRPIGVVKR